MKDIKGCSSVARPLDEAWWTRDRRESLPPDDVPMLAPYEKTRPGFELLVADACERGMDMDYFARVDGRYLQVCLWDIED